MFFFFFFSVPFGSWFQHIKLWLKFIHERKRHQPVHVIFYEDLIQVGKTLKQSPLNDQNSGIEACSASRNV